MAVAVELLDPDHVVLAITIDVRPPEVRAVHSLGELDLHRLTKGVVILVQVAHDPAVGVDAEVVGATVTRDVCKADGHYRR